MRSEARLRADSGTKYVQERPGDRPSSHSHSSLLLRGVRKVLVGAGHAEVPGRRPPFVRRAAQEAHHFDPQSAQRFYVSGAHEAQAGHSSAWCRVGPAEAAGPRFDESRLADMIRPSAQPGQAVGQTLPGHL